MVRPTTHGPTTPRHDGPRARDRTTPRPTDPPTPRPYDLMIPRPNAPPEGASAKQLTTFVEKARHGTVKNEDIVKFAKMFHDDLTLDNMGRAQVM